MAESAHVEAQVSIAPSGLMDLASAARYLGCTTSTMRWLRRMRRLPFLTLGGKLMVMQSDLDSYIEKIKTAVTA